MNRGLAILFMGLLATVSTLNGQERGTLTETHIMREDFQGDSLGQWASYPPAQDIGYEPTLAPTTQYGAPGGRALMRVVKPNLPGPLRFGFIKQIAMSVSNNAKVSLAYRINNPGMEAVLEIGLAGVNGKLYTRRVPATGNAWARAEAPVAEFRDAGGSAPAEGLQVEAIYLIAKLEHADPDITYRFIIDDLEFAAARAARFVVRAPVTKAIEPWSALLSARGYRAGDVIALEATTPVRLAEVNYTVKAPDGKEVATGRLYDDGTQGDRRSSDDIWSNSSLYSIRSNDQTGVWSVQLGGVTDNGRSVSTTVRLLVHPQKRSGHPRLYFSGADRQTLIDRSRDAKLASLWAHLQIQAKNTRASGELAHGGKVFELLDTEYLLPSLLAYFDVLNRARFRIAYNAIEAYVTGSEEARTAATSAMIDVARWERWQPPWFNAQGQHTYYPAGLLAAEVAFGYDILYDHLSEPERALIRKALIEKSIVPTFKEYVLDNRLMANTSNWIAHTVGGALIAAASIADDVEDSEANGQFEIYLHGLLLKLEDHMSASYLADGSYGEGISYHEFDMETLGPALNALRRVFGIDYWKQTHVIHSLNYALHTLTQPISGSLDMGDTHAPAGHGIPALVYESKDPVVRWYYSQFDRPSLSKFIFYDDTVVFQPPRLPTSRIFRNKGNAVFRTGWDKDAIVFLYRAGPNFNHHHADQGSFLLNAFGETLVSEAGWSDYYKDPYYATFFTQAVGHNTVLVDRDPESQSIPDTLQFKALESYPSITDSITSEFYDGVGSRLPSVYKDRLARYVRRIIFIKPYYFVVFDDLKVSGKPAQFDFLLHLPNREEIKIDDLTAIYKGEKASLAVRSFSPSDTKLSVENGRIPFHVFSLRTPAETPAQPAYLAFRTGRPMSETQFLTAIVPAKNEGAAGSLINQMSEITGENLKGLRVQRGNEIDLVMFRAGAETQTIRQGDWSADAATLAITESANTLKVFAVQDARLLRRGKQILFSSESPTSIAVNINANEIEAACSAETGTTFTLFVGKIPVRVLLDGKELSANAFSFNRTDGTISLGIPSGQHDLKISFR
ncbi:MAG TPA: heparinase II/III family protein [Pyrinomonadaceae bacterium]|nr:heparinase II/III family protein [Pyrinomonadaceae bacterium]